MRLTIFGTGYVGLVQGAVFSEVGHDVMCIDVDEQKIDRLKNGEIPIFEPGLEDLVQSNQAAGRLQFSTDPAAGVAHGEVIFLAVGTPSDTDGSADLRYVLGVARDIASHLESHRLVVTKSTVPVGTVDKVRAAIAERLRERGRTDITFDVVSNPEFLKEGAAVADCMRPERIVIGAENKASVEVLRRLYAPFNRNHDRIIAMDTRSAELTKYAANCMLATKISFMNELAGLAERVGADIEYVRKGIGSDSRIGFDFIYAGAGYGGSCFPKDVKALIRTAHDFDYAPMIIEAVEARNAAQKQVLFQKIARHYGDALSGRTLALWGLAFKPKTDDMREASSIVLINALLEAGVAVRAYDPEALDEARRIFGDAPGLTLCSSAAKALEGADGLAIVTEWQEFRAPDFDRIGATLSEKVIFDGRNLYEPAEMAERGFAYYAIGRGL